MDSKKRVAGYVKLAKLWEKHREAAMPYHNQYYCEKYADSDRFELAGVYVDITGNKKICNRPEMMRLLKDCRDGKIDCIATQTKGYLAADTREFCYLFKLLREFNGGIDLVTEDEDYNIDTMQNAENQLQELVRMAEKYISPNPADFDGWKSKSKTMKNDGSREGAYVPNHHEAIVSPEIASTAFP
ncbi:recombinase family protein [bacterium D16-51]|nr:recombinase family protein [bacterium D16-59]RKI57654.1 recombinase family protein [bacterium D16-51]